MICCCIKVYTPTSISSIIKFNEESLPPREAFLSILTQGHIKEEDYLHAQSVWKSFSIKNIGQYHDLYVKCDVLKFADVFQNFRKLCAQFYRLDCAHLLTLPGLA